MCSSKTNFSYTIQWTTYEYRETKVKQRLLEGEKVKNTTIEKVGLRINNTQRSNTAVALRCIYY